MPLQRVAFMEALRELNRLYGAHGRTLWGRVHHELYGGHVIFMEREFPDILTLDADEKQSATPDILDAKRRLLLSVVPGTVEITHYQTVDL
jgi:hypothetical protein